MSPSFIDDKNIELEWFSNINDEVSKSWLGWCHDGEDRSVPV